MVQRSEINLSSLGSQEVGATQKVYRRVASTDRQHICSSMHSSSFQVTHKRVKKKLHKIFNSQSVVQIQSEHSELTSLLLDFHNYQGQTFTLLHSHSHSKVGIW